MYEGRKIFPLIFHVFLSLFFLAVSDRFTDEQFALESAKLDYLDEVINFNKRARSRCSIVQACQGVDLSTIP